MNVLRAFVVVNNTLDLTDATLAALTVLVSVTLFTTGFLSVRIHAERTRALDRIDRSEEHLAMMISGNKPISDREVNATYDALNSVETRVARAIAYGNVVVFAAIVALSVEWVRHAGWGLFQPSLARPSLWALLAINAIELAIVVVGIFDVEQVVHNVNERKRKSYGYRLSQVYGDLRNGNTGKLVRAQERAIRLSDELPSAASPLRALGRGYLMAGEWEKALATFDKAIACAQGLPGHDDIVALAGKARALEAIGRREQAAEHLATVAGLTGSDRSNKEVLASGPVDWETLVKAIEKLCQERKPDRADNIIALLLERHVDTPAAMEATVDAMSIVVEAFRAEDRASLAKLALLRWRRVAGSYDIVTRRINDLLKTY